MGVGDGATWAGVVVALLVGVGGIIVGGLGWRQAKAASRAADDANRIATEANALSETANALAARTAARSEEDWFVDWEPEWDADQATLRLRNKGSHTAVETAVSVFGEGIHEVFDGVGDIAAGRAVEILLPTIPSLRSRWYEEHEATAAAWTRQRVAYAYGDFHTSLEVVVRWRTGLRFPESCKLEAEAS